MQNTNFPDYLQDLTCQSAIISISTAWQQLSVVASWPSSMGVIFHQCSATFNSATHLVMVAYNGALSP